MGTNVFVTEARHELCGVADEESGILYVIVACVLLRVLNRRLDDLDAIDAMRFLCQEERDGSRTAVGVDDGLFAAEVGVFKRLFVEDGGLLRIDLKKRSRRDGKAQSADAVGNRRLSPEEFRFAPQYDIVAVRLDILLHALEIRHALSEKARDFFCFGQILRRRDEDDHGLAVFSDAADDVAQDARVTIFIVDGNVQVLDNLAHDVDDGVVAVLLNPTVPRVDDVMRAFGKAADDGLSALFAYGKLHLVAVEPRLFRT